MNENTTGSTVRLKSDLARLCLPQATRDADRSLAWMSSICLLFLAIGLGGTRPAVVAIRPPPAAREVVPAIVEPVAPPPRTVRELAPAEIVPDAPPEAAAIVVVAPDAPEIAFAVPTLGQLIVPTTMAVAPPVRPLTPPSPRPMARIETPATVPIDPTGLGGERPHPPYPPAALERRQQGTVVLSLEVDETGAIQMIAVKSSSGSAILDRSTLDFVKRHWKIPPGAGTRRFEATVKYRLEAG